MAKTAIDAPRKDMFMVEPERLRIIMDPAHPRYDPRSQLDPDENMIRNVMVHGVLQPIIVSVTPDGIRNEKSGSDSEGVARANERLDVITKAEGGDA